MMKIPGMPEIPSMDSIKTSAMDFAANSAGSLISMGGAFLINALFGNQWGVVSQYGIPILLADNVVSLNYKNSSRISNAPVEKGSFASYNKVADPSVIHLQMTKGSHGTMGRGAFLTQLEILQKTTLKFYIITPEFVYMNYNLTGFDLSRESKDGATLIKVNLTLEEVREVKASYSNTNANPEDTPTKDVGEVKTYKQADLYKETTIGSIT